MRQNDLRGRLVMTRGLKSFAPRRSSRAVRRKIVDVRYRDGRRPAALGVAVSTESSQSKPTWRLGHEPALDGLRGVAVAIIVAYHLDPRAMPGGPLGVDLFFVLSGFLITSVLIDEHASTGTIRVRAFYVRRARRLFPALAVFLVVVGSIMLGVHAWSDFVTLGYVVGYVANYAWNASHLAAPVQHCWSLSIEEQFYLVWPIVLVALLRFRSRWMTTVPVAVLVVAVVMQEPSRNLRCDRPQLAGGARRELGSRGRFVRAGRKAVHPTTTRGLGNVRAVTQVVSNQWRDQSRIVDQDAQMLTPGTSSEVRSLIFPNIVFCRRLNEGVRRQLRFRRSLLGCSRECRSTRPHRGWKRRGVNRGNGATWAPSDKSSDRSAPPVIPRWDARGVPWHRW